MTDETVLGYEQALLGGLLWHPAELDRPGMPPLQPAMFVDPRHGSIYSAITAAWTRTGLPAPQTVIAELEAVGELGRVGGAVRISELAGAGATAGAIHWHADRVLEASKLRAIQAAATRVQAQVTGPAPADTASFDQLITGVWDDLQRAFTETHDPGRATETADEVIQRRLDQVRNGDTETHIPTGLMDLDRRTPLLVPGRVTILGARPAVGKSQMALQVARNAALQGHRTIYLSLEMAAESLADRMMAAQARVPVDHIKQPDRLTAGEWSRLDQAQATLRGIPLEILATGNLSVADIATLVRRSTRLGDPVRLLVLDYIQLVAGRRTENRQVEVAEISRGIKKLAMDHGVAVLAVAQVNRASETFADKRPTLAMLKESGALEADADQVLLLHRDDIYAPESDRAGMLDIIIAKARDGATGTVTVTHLFEYAMVADLIHEA
jgi:replicative DNA helicase